MVEETSARNPTQHGVPDRLSTRNVRSSVLFTGERGSRLNHRMIGGTWQQKRVGTIWRWWKQLRRPREKGEKQAITSVGFEGYVGGAGLEIFAVANGNMAGWSGTAEGIFQAGARRHVARQQRVLPEAHVVPLLSQRRIQLEPAFKLGLSMRGCRLDLEFKSSG